MISGTSKDFPPTPFPEAFTSDFCQLHAPGEKEKQVRQTPLRLGVEGQTWSSYVYGGEMSS